MKLTAQVQYKKEVLDRIERLHVAPELLLKQLESAGLKIMNQARRNIQQVSPGKKQYRYTKPRGKRLVTVSRPGDPPNTDTGTAIKSIRREVDAEDFSVSVGTRLGYLALLEKAGSQKLRRPWLRPAVEWFKEKFGNKIFKIRMPR